MHRRHLAALLGFACTLVGCKAVAGLDGIQLCLEEDAPPTASCRLVAPQCGCEDGLACNIAGSAGERVCIEGGAAGPGDLCATVNACRPGTLCLPFSEANGICVSYCETSADCAGHGAGSTCTRLSSVATGVCDVPCDPFDPEGTCGPGIACSGTGSTGICRNLGPVGLLLPCGPDSAAEFPNDQCQQGLECIANSSGNYVCFEQCGPGNPCADPLDQCSVPTEPGVVREAGAAEYGICARVS